MPIERINITPTRMTAKNTCSGIVFDTCNQYIRTDTSCNFVFDYAVAAPRPAKRNAMGECMGAVLMHDYYGGLAGYNTATSTCCQAYDCSFSFTQSGWISVQTTLASSSTGTLYSGGSSSSCCPYYVLDVWHCCTHPNCNVLEKVYCYAPGFVIWNEGQAGSGCTWFTLSPNIGLCMAPTPQGGCLICAFRFGCCAVFYNGSGTCDWSAGAHQFGCGFWCTKKCGMNNQFYIKVDEYSQTCVRIYRCWPMFMMSYGSSSGSCVADAFLALPVSMDFCTSACLPLAVTC